MCGPPRQTTSCYIIVKKPRWNPEKFVVQRVIREPWGVYPDRAKQQLADTLEEARALVPKGLILTRRDETYAAVMELWTP